MTSSLFGSVPVTAQKTFWSPTANRSSHHGATRVAICEVGIEALNGVVKELVKLTLPLLLTKSVVKLPPPKAIGNGEVIDAEESSPRLRFVPVIVL